MYHVFGRFFLATTLVRHNQNAFSIVVSHQRVRTHRSLPVEEFFFTSFS
jgi:hypothetical protein